jgi:hypothetical protein
MLGKISKLCDCVDRVVIKWFGEGLWVGIFSLMAMLAASVGGMCMYGVKLFRDKYGDSTAD